MRNSNIGESNLKRRKVSSVSVAAHLVEEEAAREGQAKEGRNLGLLRVKILGSMVPSMLIGLLLDN